MQRKLLFIIVMASLAVSLCASARAELSAEQQQRAKDCVARFTSRMFQERQEAVDELVRMGPGVIPFMREALAAAEDNEIKLRCEMVLKGIRAAHILGADDRLLNIEASRHSLDVKDQPLGEVLEALARASGNRALKLRASIEKKPVTVQVKDLPYWQVMDEIRRSAGLVYNYDYNSGWLTLSEGKPEPDIGVLVGPAVVKFSSMSRSVTLTGGAEVRSLSISCLCVWEDRLPITYGKLLLTKVRAEDGTELPIQNSAAMHGWWDTYAARQSVSIYNPPMIRGDTVDLTGSVRLEFAVGRREALVDDVFSEGEKTVDAEGLNLVIKEARQWDRESRVTVKGMLKGNYPSIHTLSPDYGLFLRDPDGKRIEPRKGGGPYVAGGFQVELIFDVERRPGKWSLVLIYPERAEVRDYPFELKKVPLP